jgi:hypothetical protein
MRAKSEYGILTKLGEGKKTPGERMVIIREGKRAGGRRTDIQGGGGRKSNTLSIDVV